MDGTSDLFCPAMLFTLLAIIVAAAVFMGRNKAPAPSKCSHQTSTAVEERAGPDPDNYKQHRNESNQRDIQLQSTAKSLKTKDETIKHEKVSIYSAL